MEIKSTVFRPNFVIEMLSLEGKSVDTSKMLHSSSFLLNWKSITISLSTVKKKNLTLRSCGPCQRCSMINVDGSTGRADQQDSRQFFLQLPQEITVKNFFKKRKEKFTLVNFLILKTKI
jgi:uncharacterized protein YcbX